MLGACHAHQYASPPCIWIGQASLCWELYDKLPVGDKDVDSARVQKCVYVQYCELDDMEARVPCKWKIGDLSPGVYLVTPITRT